jgi:hypothetical protein
MTETVREKKEERGQWGGVAAMWPPSAFCSAQSSSREKPGEIFALKGQTVQLRIMSSWKRGIWGRGGLAPLTPLTLNYPGSFKGVWNGNSCPRNPEELGWTCNQNTYELYNRCQSLCVCFGE